MTNPKAPSTPNPPASGDREEPKKLDPKQGHLVKAWNKLTKKMGRKGDPS